MWMDLYTLKSLGKSHLKDPRYFNAFMNLAEFHLLYTLAETAVDDNYATPHQIADMANNLLGILNNLGSFTVENEVDVYNIDYTRWTKSNTKNYKNNISLIDSFLDGKVITQKNLGDAPFKAKMFTH